MDNNFSGEVWVVGKVTDDCPSWEFEGVFSSRVKAIQACTTANHFVGPADLDAVIPAESVEWPGAFYPLRELNLGRLLEG